MGFSNNNQSSPKIYTNIVGGKLAVRTDKAGNVAPDGTIAKTRIAENKSTGEKKEVHEFLYDELSGIIESVSCEKNEKLKAYQYLVTIDDVGSKYIISIPADSKYGDSLATKLPNVKAGEYLTLKPYDFEDKNKINPHNGKPQKLVGISIVQNGVKIAPYYTQEQPNGRPLPSTERMDEDDFKIHMTIVRKFYRGEVSNWNLNQGAAKSTPPAPAATPSTSDSAVINDLPFDVDEDGSPF
jgi:hypothetical protein